MYAIGVTVQGTIISDVEERVTDAGRKWSRFRLAANERIHDRLTGTWSDGETTYFTVKCWGRLAENVCASVSKGMPVVVHGRLNQRHYSRSVAGQDVPGHDLELAATTIGPDLSKGVATFERTKSPAVQRAEERALADVEAAAAALRAGPAAPVFDG